MIFRLWIHFLSRLSDLRKSLNPALVRSMEECRVGLCAGMDEAGQ